MAYFVDITARANTKDAESKMLALTNRMQDAFKKVATWSISAVVFQQMSKFFTSGIGYVKELDKSLTDIAVVTGMSRNQMAGVTVEFNKMAKSLGVTTKEVANASLIYYQQGKSAQEVMQLTRATAMTAAITETKDLAEASSYITAALNGFKMSASQSMDVVDKFAQVGAQAGTSFREMALALSRTASSANNAGISLDAMLGMMGTVSEVTREAPENIGTSFKTIIARLRNITSEEGADLLGTKELNKVDGALASIGISVRGFDGEMRDLEPVLYEVGNKWGSLDKNTQAYLATVLAGTRQQSRLISMFDNWDRVLELTTMSQNSAGAGMDQFSRHAEGLDFAINRVQTSFEELFSDTFKTEDMKNIVNDFGFFLEAIVSLNKSLPALSAAFKMLGFGALALALPKIAAGLGFVKNGITQMVAAGRLASSVPGGILGTSAILGHRTQAGLYEKIDEEIKKQFNVQKVSSTQRQAYINYLNKQQEIENQKIANANAGVKKGNDLAKEQAEQRKAFSNITKNIMQADKQSTAALAVQAREDYDKKLKEAVKNNFNRNMHLSQTQLAQFYDERIQQYNKEYTRYNNRLQTFERAIARRDALGAQTRVPAGQPGAGQLQRLTPVQQQARQQANQLRTIVAAIRTTEPILPPGTTAELAAAGREVTRFQTSTNQAASAIRNLNTQLGATQKIGAFIGNVGWMVAFAALFEGIAWVKDQAANSMKVLEQQSELKKNRRDLYEDLNKINKYQAIYNELKDKGTKTTAEGTEYASALQELSSLYPEIVSARDAEGKVIDINSTKLEKLISLKRKEKELTEKQIQTNSMKNPVEEQGVFGYVWNTFTDPLTGDRAFGNEGISGLGAANVSGQDQISRYNRLLMTYGEDYLRTLDTTTQDIISDYNLISESDADMNKALQDKIKQIQSAKIKEVPGSDEWGELVRQESEYQTALLALSTGMEASKQNQASIAAVSIKYLDSMKQFDGLDEEILNKYTSVLTEGQTSISETFQMDTQKLFSDQSFGPLIGQLATINKREQEINNSSILSFNQRQDALKELYTETEKINKELNSSSTFDKIKSAYDISEGETLAIVNGLKKESKSLSTEVENTMQSQILLRNVSHESLMNLKDSYQSIDFDTLESSAEGVKKIMSQVTDPAEKAALNQYFKGIFDTSAIQKFAGELGKLKFDNLDLDKNLDAINQSAITTGLGKLDFSGMSTSIKEDLLTAAKKGPKVFIDAYNMEMDRLPNGIKINLDEIDTQQKLEELKSQFPQLIEMTLKLKVDSSMAGAAYEEFGKRIESLTKIRDMAKEGAVTADYGSQIQMDFQQAIYDYAAEYNPSFAEEIQYKYEELVANGTDAAEAASKAYTDVLAAIDDEASNAENAANTSLVEANKRSTKFYDLIKNHEELLDQFKEFQNLTDEQQKNIKDHYKDYNTTEELLNEIDKIKYLKDSISDNGAKQWLGISGDTNVQKETIENFQDAYTQILSISEGAISKYDAALLSANIATRDFSQITVDGFKVLSGSEKGLNLLTESFGLTSTEIETFKTKMQSFKDDSSSDETISKYIAGFAEVKRLKTEGTRGLFKEQGISSEFAQSFIDKNVLDTIAGEDISDKTIDMYNQMQRDLITAQDDFYTAISENTIQELESSTGKIETNTLAFLDSLNLRNEKYTGPLQDAINAGTVTKDSIQNVLNTMSELAFSDESGAAGVTGTEFVDIAIKYNYISEDVNSEDIINQIKTSLGLGEGEVIPIETAITLVTGGTVEGQTLAEIIGEPIPTPKPIEVYISADAASAVGPIGEANAALATFLSYDGKLVTITTNHVDNYTTTGQGLGGILGFATGTPFAKGGLSLVGEEGRELVILPDGTQTMVGTDGAQLINLPEGSTILSNTNTESLFNRSKRKFLYSGTIPSFSTGTPRIIQSHFDEESNSSSASSSNDGKEKATKDAEKFFDLLEEALERIDQKIEVIQDRIDDTFDIDDKISLSKEYLSLLEHQESVMEKGFALRKTAYQDEIKNVRQLGILTSDQLDAIIEGNFNLSELGISISNDNKDAQKALDDLIKARDDYYNLEQKIQKIDNDILSVMQDMVDAVDDMDLSLEQKAVEYIKVNNQLRSQELRFIDQKYKVQEQIRNQEAEALKAKYTEIAAQEVFNSIQTEAIQNLDVETLKILNLGNFIDQGLRQTMLDFIATFVQADAELNEVQDTVKGIENSIKEANAAWLNTYVEQYNDAIDESKTNISLLDNFQASLVENSDEYIANINDQNTSLVEQVKLLTQQKAFYEYALNNLELTAEEQRNIKESIRGINEEIASARAEIFNQLQSLANDVIEMYKQVLEEQKEQDLDRIDDLIDAEDERHDKIMDDLQDELDMWNSIIEAKLKALKREKEADDYNEQLSKLEEERQELQDLINALAIDTSYEAQAKLKKLGEELSDKELEISELKEDRQYELREQNLNDMLDLYEKDVEAKEDAEDEKYEATKKALEQEKEDRERFWDDQINNEARWMRIRRDILNGNLTEVKADFAEFGSFIKANLDDIGNNIGMNMIDQMSDFITEIQNAQSALTQLNSISANYNSNNLQGTKGTPVSTPSSSGQMTPKAKALIKKMITEYDNNGGDMYILQRRIQELADNFGIYVKLVNGHYQITNGSYAGTNLRALHSGGIVGNISNEATEIANKLLNTSPNERVIKALVGELYSPADNIRKNFIPNLTTALESVQPIGLIGSGGNNYELNMNIESLNGTKKDAQTVFKEIVKGFRAMGGGV